MCSHRNYCRIHHQNKSSLPKKYVSLEVSAGGSTDTCAPVVIIAAYMMRKSLLCHKKYVSLEVCAGGSTCIHMCVLLL